MTAAVRSKKKQTILRRALDLGIRKPAPPDVIAWVQNHLKLPASDVRRMKKLYDKSMDATLSGMEIAELDSLMDACTAMDLVRARLIFGIVPNRNTAK